MSLALKLFLISVVAYIGGAVLYSQNNMSDLSNLVGLVAFGCLIASIVVKVRAVHRT